MSDEAEVWRSTTYPRSDYVGRVHELEPTKFRVWIWGQEAGHVKQYEDLTEAQAATARRLAPSFGDVRWVREDEGSGWIALPVRS